MAVEMGERLPEGRLLRMGAGGPEAVETRDLFAERAPAARDLYRELREWKSRRHPVLGESKPATLDEEQLEKLRSLGYLPR